MVAFARMLQAFAEFSIAYPGRKFRHEKVDITVLLERRDETYVDIAEVPWLCIGRPTKCNTAICASHAADNLCRIVT